MSTERLLVSITRDHASSEGERCPGGGSCHVAIGVTTRRARRFDGLPVARCLLVDANMNRLAWLALACAFGGCDMGEEKIWALKPDSGPRVEYRMIHHDDSIEYPREQDAEYPPFGGGEFLVEVADIYLDRDDNHVSIHVHESGLYFGDTFRSHHEFWIDANIVFQPDIDFVDGTLRVAYWNDTHSHEEREERRNRTSTTFEGVAYPIDWCGDDVCEF
jgi:hypothetical protein